MSRLSPEGYIAVDDLLKIIVVIFRPQFMIAQSGVKGNIAEECDQILPRQLVVRRRSFLDNIPRRHTEGGRTLLRPERPQIAKHGREPLRVIRSPLLRRIIVQVAKGPEV